MTQAMFKLCLFWILLASCFLYEEVAGQKPPTENELKLRTWFQRIDELKSGIVQDSTSVAPADQALYLTLLAKFWVKVDQSESKKLLAKSSGLILAALEKDDKNAQRNLQLSQKVIQISYEIDNEQGNRLVTGIAKLFSDSSDTKLDKSEILATLGCLIAPKDPRLAYQYGIQSLKFGSSLQIARLSFELLKADPSLGEELFKKAISSSRSNYNYEFISSLGGYVFASTKTGYSLEAQRSYLELLADQLAIAVIDPNDHSRCELVPVITQFLSSFEDLVAPRALAVKQGLETCIQFSNPTTAGILKDKVKGEEPVSADEFIQAAKDTTDTAKKSHYYYRAIAKLVEIPNYDRIINLLDDMTEVEKKAFNPQNWLSLRTDYAAKAAFLAFQNKDFAVYYRVLTKCPNAVRPYVRFRLVPKLSSAGETNLVLENLEEIQKEISTLEAVPREAAGNFLALADLYLKIRPTDSEKMFREAVKSINRTDSDNPDFLAEKDYAPLRDYVAMSDKLLEIDETSILTSLSNISSRRSRVRLKLGLLESSAKRYEEFRKRVEAEKAPKK
ncbi:MAG: hypothetical protein QM785_00800 [Pyrinomonadaceae bacterium]